ncbi:hypothetical protein BO99DRAFT_401609 [Aspergillus violaceofuscus CBS 115571]|uniref:Secreted protein n=1 Tax=Aspergillus violaceofuscus (strain CBS 115571) TaxID=1450538 RepID=A0A2V5H8P9_ASPV1|nr:hypothetical protein BO99DRAFT_401609 [Aspergillus violaceofuscus CBS 115571]
MDFWPRQQQSLELTWGRWVDLLLLLRVLRVSRVNAVSMKRKHREDEKSYCLLRELYAACTAFYCITCTPCLASLIQTNKVLGANKQRLLSGAGQIE